MNVYRNTKPLFDEDGKLKFTGLKPGDLAETVIMPGDPHRCELISKHFGTSTFVGQRSTFATYTGTTKKGTPVSVVSSGMGCMCVALALEEFRHLGVKTVIRLGTCNSLQSYIEPGTMAIATGCVRGEGASYEYVPAEFPAVADFQVVSALEKAAKDKNEIHRVGLYRSHDAFYMESNAAHPGLYERMEKWRDAKVIAEENESGTLFPLGYLLGIRTGSICITLSHMLGGIGTDASVFPQYDDPDFLAKRIDAETEVVLHAIDLLKEEDSNAI